MEGVARVGSAPLHGLMEAALGDLCTGPAHAEAVVAAALELGVDPLDYCIRHFRLDENEAIARAAHRAGFPFSPVVPPGLPVGTIARLDALAKVRTLRGQLYGHDLTFVAPRYDELQRLATARLDNIDLARRICIVPARALRGHFTNACSDQLLTEARQRLTRQWPYASANVDLPSHVRAGFVVLFALVAVTVAAAPFFMRELVLPLLAILLLLPALLKLVAALSPSRRPPHAPLLSDAELPVYTVLIPLRDEAAMVPMLERAMLALDYPPEKLDIKFVVEERSPETVEAVRAVLRDQRFEMVVVPDAMPRTKPKALNFTMPLVRGEHVVVYDAEDIPDRSQLRLAASRFAADTSLDCLQAELVIDNAEESWVTALFAGEYAGQFGPMLHFIGRWRLPMPLGGTSNHFRVAALRELGHWDAFNVTEDADLGTRLSRLRYQADMLPSHTSEEAPITLRAWMAQRTRWIKGWMQTFIVHNSRPRRFLGDIGWRNFLFFQIFVGNLILSSLLHTVFLTSLLVRAAIGYWPSLDDGMDAAYLVILVVGYGAATVLVIAGLVRLRRWDLVPMQVLLPVYWAMHSIAAMRAAHQLLVRPYFWGKTEHGRTQRPRSFVPASALVAKPGEAR